MIKIKKSETADTRSCDYANVTKETLKKSSEQHIADVAKGITFFKEQLDEAAKYHDFDKLSELEKFHDDFVTGFKSTSWYENHKKVNRHHLADKDGVPHNVNLVDVIEMVVDCVMAGLGRTGKVTPIKISNEVLQDAVANTVALLKKNVEVENSDK